MRFDLNELLSVPAAPAAPETGSPPAASPEAPAAIPGIATEAELAALLGVAASTVRTKKREGLMIPAGRGRYDVRATLHAYLDRLRETAGRAGNPAAGADPDALKAEKLRLTRAQADKEETRVQRERGELVSAIEVEREWGNLLRDLRNALLAVPSRFASQTPHMTAADIAALDAEIRIALEGVANGN